MIDVYHDSIINVMPKQSRKVVTHIATKRVSRKIEWGMVRFCFCMSGRAPATVYVLGLVGLWVKWRLSRHRSYDMYASNPHQ